MPRSCNFTPIWCNRNFSTTAGQSIDVRDDITIDVFNIAEYLTIIIVIMVQGLQEKVCPDRKMIFEGPHRAGILILLFQKFL